MGSNYYAYIYEDENKTTKKEQIHIGKSSKGWVFMLHRIREKGLIYWSDWKLLLQRPNVSICCHNTGEYIPFDVFVGIVEDRGFLIKPSHYPYEVFGKIYKNEQEWAEEAGGIVGPNNLLRTKQKEQHGEGTWDYVVGDFI
jgi:hypothetical protein